MLPAVAQGAIGIEIKSGSGRARKLVEAIHDHDTGVVITCERAFLATLDGSCRTPLAGHATLRGNALQFRGQALTPDGVYCFEFDADGLADDATAMGTEIGRKVKESGGSRLW